MNVAKYIMPIALSWVTGKRASLVFNDLRYLSGSDLKNIY